MFDTKYMKKSPKKVKKFATGGMVNREAKEDSEFVVAKDESRYGGADLPPGRAMKNEFDYYTRRNNREGSFTDDQKKQETIRSKGKRI